MLRRVHQQASRLVTVQRPAAKSMLSPDSSKNSGPSWPEWDTAMNARYRTLFSTVIFICTLFVAPGAHAESINAASYAIGTNVSNAIPGVTLSYETYINGAHLGNGTNAYGTLTKSPLLISTGYPVNAQNNLANTFGGITYDLQILLAPSQDWYESWDGIDAEFSHPIHSITINGFVSSGLPLTLFAYDTSGSLIGWSETNLSSGYYCLYYVSATTGDSTCYNVGQHTSFTSTTPIGSIIYGGYLDDGYATEIDIPGLVSEPGTLGLLFVGWMGLSLAARRRARPQR